MAGRHAVVTLHPVYSPDTLPFRSLTFASDNDVIPIGRSSKSQLKNLVPLHNNGWFESRVMSRNHADLGVLMKEETVYVRDTGSMHGTTVNEKKIPSKEKVSIQSGDVLTFGNEVTRGSEIFRPVAVRCEYEWFNDSDPGAAPSKTTAGKPTTNSFSVPDDDDEVVEILPESAPVEIVSHRPVVISDSDVESGSDRGHPMDLSSPVTSPVMRHSDVSDEKAAKAATANEQSAKTNTDIREGSQHSPILLDYDNPPVESNPPGSYPNITVRMELPDNETDSDEDSESSTSERWSSDDENASEEENPDVGMSAQPEEGEDEDEDDGSSDSDAQSQSRYIWSPSPTPREHAAAESEGRSNGVQSFADSRKLSPPREKSSNQRQIQQPPQFTPRPRVGTQRLAAGGQIPTIFPQEMSQMSDMGNSSRFQDNWSVDYSIHRIPSPSDKAMAKTSNEALPSYTYGTYAQTFEGWPSIQAPGQSPPLPFPHYAPAIMANNLGSYSTSAQEQYAFVNQSSENYVSHYADRANVPSQYLHVSPSSFEGIRGLARASEYVRSQSHPAEKNDKPALDSAASTTRVSISDIVENSSGESHSAEHPNSLKRKAADFEADNTTSGTDHDLAAALDDGSLPDAQPQPTVEDPLLPESQLTDLCSLDESKLTHTADVDIQTSEPRRKRVKTENQHGNSFVRYAAAAVMGVVVGGIGTIATLASLPPNFFD